MVGFCWFNFCWKFKKEVTKVRKIKKGELPVKIETTKKYNIKNKSVGIKRQRMQGKYKSKKKKYKKI